MKVKRSINNLIVGVLSQLITLGLSFLIPRLIILNFGSEINGLLSSIGQFIVYINLLEAGVGTATIQALYSRVEKKDVKSINSVLAATNSYYKRTSLYYLISIVVLSLTYPVFVKSSYDYFTVSSIVFLTSIGGVVTYFYLGKYKLLLIAEGKDYVNVSIATLISIFSIMLKLFLLTIKINIVMIQSYLLIVSLLQVFAYEVYIRRHYVWIDFKEIPDFKAISQRGSVFIHQISSLIFNNTDVIILSVISGLKIVSVYILYNMVFGYMESIIKNISSSTTSAFGQVFSRGDDKFSEFFEAFEVYFLSIMFAVFLNVFLFITPFIKLYTMGVNDISYIDPYLPLLFVTVKLLSFIRTPTGNFISIAGHFKLTQVRSIIESTINITMSIILVWYIGIYGVLIGTIVALLYRTLDIIFYSSKYILKRNPWISIKRIIINTALFALIGYLYFYLDLKVSSYIDLLISASLYFSFTMIIFIFVDSIADYKMYKFSVNYFRQSLIRNRFAK